MTRDLEIPIQLIIYANHESMAARHFEIRFNSNQTIFSAYMEPRYFQTEHFKKALTDSLVSAITACLK